MTDRPLTEDDIRRIVREEMHKAACAVITVHAGQRARLITGVRKPLIAPSADPIEERPPFTEVA